MALRGHATAADRQSTTFTGVYWTKLDEAKTPESDKCLPLMRTDSWVLVSKPNGQTNWAAANWRALKA